MVSLQEERVPFDLDIRMWGMATDGRAFSQHARTQNISASGARLCEIEHDVKIGDTIGVQAGQRKARCKIVWARDTRSIQKIQVGVQLLSKRECPWIPFLSKTNQDAPTVGRRRWARHKIAFPIALHDDRTLVRVTATDVSGSGCYVEMLSPFPIGTSLGAELWIGTEKVTTRALVRTCDPRVGMGIEFVGLKTEDQRRLQDHLQAAYPFSCSIEDQNPMGRKNPKKEIWPQMRPSDQVRAYAYRHYILPARAKKSPAVTFLSGPIHKALGFKNLMPCVCDALGTSKFQTDCRIRLIGRTGPKHGATASFTFSV